MDIEVLSGKSVVVDISDNNFITAGHFDILNCLLLTIQLMVCAARDRTDGDKKLS